MGALILAGVLAAAVPGQAGSPSLADRVIEHKLANGMTVLMVERHQAPIVSVNMTFGVGGVNEQVGQTGLAHLYEHMAFKGTRTVGTRDYEREQAVLDDLAMVGTELDRREREEAARAQQCVGRRTVRSGGPAQVDTTHTRHPLQPLTQVDHVG